MRHERLSSGIIIRRSVHLSPSAVSDRLSFVTVRLIFIFVHTTVCACACACVRACYLFYWCSRYYSFLLLPNYALGYVMYRKVGYVVERKIQQQAGYKLQQ